MYVYRATVNRVIDGDTIEVTVDLGFCASLRQTVRLYGINAPELHGASFHAGRDARDYLSGLLPTGTQVLFNRSRPTEKQTSTAAGSARSDCPMAPM